MHHVQALTQSGAGLTGGGPCHACTGSTWLRRKGISERLFLGGLALAAGPAAGVSRPAPFDAVGLTLAFRKPTGLACRGRYFFSTSTAAVSATLKYRWCRATVSQT